MRQERTVVKVETNKQSKKTIVTYSDKIIKPFVPFTRVDINVNNHWSHGFSLNSPVVYGSINDIGKLKIGDTIMLGDQKRQILKITILKQNGCPLITYSGDIIKPFKQVKCPTLSTEFVPGHWKDGFHISEPIILGIKHDIRKIKIGDTIAIQGGVKKIEAIAIDPVSKRPLITYSAPRITPPFTISNTAYPNVWKNGFHVSAPMALGIKAECNNFKVDDIILIKGQARTITEVQIPESGQPHITYSGERIED